MIVSPERMNSTPRWLIAGILLMALGIMPLGVAYARDSDAVGKRLRAAVKAGEISREQADVMMGALKRSEEPVRRSEKGITR